MRHRAVLVVVAIAVLLAWGSAAGPGRLWIVQPAGIEQAPGLPAEPRPPDTTTPREERSGTSGSVEIIPQLLLGAIVVAGLVAMVSTRGAWRWPLGSSGLGGRLRRRRFEALSDMADGTQSLNLDGARAALSRGTARNAIVGCWMELERQAAAAGWVRDDAETSTEYVERVVAASSVDREAISQLATLYLEARFSQHVLPDDRRLDALSALAAAEAALLPAQRIDA